MRCAYVTFFFIDGSTYNLSSAEGYNIDPNGISVVGISAGGAMVPFSPARSCAIHESVLSSIIGGGVIQAVQMHVAFSSSIRGAGVIAGVPYWCTSSYSLLRSPS